jgi:hypothetical protein
MAGNHPKRLSTLAGLCGSEAKFDEIQEVLVSDEERSVQEVGEILQNFFRANEGTEVGYVLKQRTEKDGKGAKRLIDGYEVGSWFYPGDEATVKYWQAQEAKDPKGTKITYEVPF